MKEHLRIAIADDDSTCREFLRFVLRRLGHEVVCAAENGRELLEHCLQSPPDLVITDVQMPQLDGISAAAAIAAQHELPIVLLSGSDLPAEIASLNRVQVLVRRIKPISRVDLELLLAEIVASEVIAGLE